MVLCEPPQFLMHGGVPDLMLATTPAVCWDSTVHMMIFTFVATWQRRSILAKSQEKKTIQLGLKMFISQYSSDYGLIMAGSVLSLIPVLIVFLVLQKYFVEGVASTGLKG